MTSGAIEHEMKSNRRRRPTLLLSDVHLSITSRIVLDDLSASAGTTGRTPVRSASEPKPIPLRHRRHAVSELADRLAGEARTGQPARPSRRLGGHRERRETFEGRWGHRLQRSNGRSGHRNPLSSRRLGGFLQTSCLLVNPRPRDRGWDFFQNSALQRILQRRTSNSLKRFSNREPMRNRVFDDEYRSADLAAAG